MTDASADNPEMVSHQPDFPTPQPEVVEAPAMMQTDAPLLDESGHDLRVRLPVFEGPLDLLLYLIKKDELDIYDIPIERITRQYLDYLQMMKMLDLEVAGEFLVVAATLLYIKSRTLLPKDLQPPEEDAEEDDPRWDLIRQLVEYKKFKDAAWQLHLKQLEQEKTYQRGAEVVVPERAAGSSAVGDLGIFDLINAFQKVLARVNQSEDLKEIFEDRFTVSDKINTIQQMLTGRERIFFEDLFVGVASRTEIVVTFLALLELIRLKFLRVTQADPFAEIEIAHAIDSTPLFQRQEEGSNTPGAPSGYDTGSTKGQVETVTEPVDEIDEAVVEAVEEPVEPVAVEESETVVDEPIQAESEPVPTTESILEPVEEETAPEPSDAVEEPTPETLEGESPLDDEPPVEASVSEETIPDDESATEPQSDAPADEPLTGEESVSEESIDPATPDEEPHTPDEPRP